VALFLKRLLGVILIILTLAYLLGPLFGAPWRIGRYDLAALFIIYLAVSTWIISIRMRRKIKRDLGREATDADLTSIDTWIKVEEVEERNRKNKP
jgi:membrane protease YdiL (CAAX protease family)